MQQLQPFGLQLIREHIDAREITAGTGEATDVPLLYRFTDSREYDRGGAGRALQRGGRSSCAAKDYVRVQPKQFRGRYTGSILVTKETYERKGEGFLRNLVKWLQEHTTSKK